MGLGSSVDALGADKKIIKLKAFSPSRALCKT